MSSGSLRTRAARGVLWALGSTAVVRGLSALSLVVLARLLAPEHFGVVAFAVVFITYVNTLGDLGAGMALIYWPDRREDAAQLTFLLNLVTGLVWLALGWLVAPLVADFFHHPDATPILRALVLSFPLRALGNTHDALCRRDLRFRARLVPEAGLAIAKALVAIPLALAGLGAWSLVWGQLAGFAAWSALHWVVTPWRPSARIPRDLIRPMLGYGRGIVGINVLAAILHHLDLVIVGRVLGPATLGLYQVAAKLPEVTITTVMWVAERVLFPTFSRLQGDRERLARAYLTALRYVSLVTVPAAIALAVLAEPLVAVVLGEKWIESAPILQALAVYTGLRSIGSQAGDVMKATGRPGLLARLGVVKGLVLVPALILSVRHGAVALAWTLVAVTVITVAINLFVIARLLPVDARSLTSALVPGLELGVVILLAALGCEALLAGAWVAIRLLVGGLSIALAVVAVLWLRHRELLEQAWQALRAGGAPGEGASSVAGSA